MCANLILATTGMRNEEHRHSKENRSTWEGINKFLGPDKRLVKFKLGYEMESLIYPWNKVAKALMKLFTLEGRYSDI